jgi:hypothetical protein
MLALREHGQNRYERRQETGYEEIRMPDDVVSAARRVRVFIFVL